MDFVAFTIDSLEMGSTAFNDKIWRTHYLLLIEGFTAFTHDTCYIWSPPFPCSPKTALTHKRWRSQYILKRDDVHDIYTGDMEITAFIIGRWITQHLLMREGVHHIYS